MKKVVLYKRLSAPLMERLRERVEVLLVEEPGRDGLARLRDALPEAHGLLGASLRLDAGLLDLAPRLEAIASVSVGVDNYDIDYLDRRGILLSNTPDVLTETTADTGFALILATARRVVELAGWVRAGNGRRASAPPSSVPTCMARPSVSSAWAASASPGPARAPRLRHARAVPQP